jgi:hypothetical protein
MLSLYRKLFPFSARDAGVPGLSKPRPLSSEEKVASAASYLARHAAKARADARKYLIRLKCAELREGPVSRIADRDSVVAPVRALREVRG